MSICKRSQGFGLNMNPLYAAAGQKGHTGVDDTCGYGSKVYALKKGIVYKIIDNEHPAQDGSGYWGVFIIAMEADGRYCEWQIGHLSKIYVKPGDLLEPWDFIGEEGNRGGVYSGGLRITKAMQDAGDKRGSHRHYNKKYLSRLTETQRDLFRGASLTEYSTKFPPTLYKDKEGFSYGVNDTYNGYNGSVDCARDIEDGRRIVEEHFAKQPTPAEIEKLQLGIIQKMLNAIARYIDSLRGRTH